MKYKREGMSIFHLIVNICAIIGGVFVIAGLIDSVIYKWKLKFNQDKPLDLN